MVRTVPVIVGVAVASALVMAAPAPAPEGPVYALPHQDPQPQQQGDLRLTMSNPGVHPRIGIQPMAIAGGSPALREVADTIADVLASDLEFEEEFYVIGRSASNGVPAAMAPESLPFNRWIELGADSVLMGTLRPADGKLEVEVRIIGVKGNAQGKQLFGQRYGGCTEANPRFCAHSIADDIHKELRDLTGVARTRIVFSSDRDAERMTGRMIEDSGFGKEIYLMDYDGALERRVTVNRSTNIGAAWGPDGRTLAYASYASNYPDVYLTMLDGRPPTRPAQGTETIHNHSPAISPDGTKVAFTSSRSGQTGYYDIWVANRDGTGLRNLTPGTPKSSEGTPSWSPNGAQIAFTSDRTGVNQIYIMNADGTGVRRITFAEKCDRPSWSVLNYIAYTLERPGGKDIAVTDLSTLQARVLTDGLGANEQPTVAPNGRHIAFVTSRYGKRQIATIDYPAGRKYRQLTNAGNNSYPNWSPTPGR